MTEQTPAELAAEAIMFLADDALLTVKSVAEIITRHLGDGRDKERMDWTLEHCVIVRSYKQIEAVGLHTLPNRSAIDAERNTERNAKSE